MKRLKIECPINFLSDHDLMNLLEQNDFVLDNDDPECIIVNPGTEKFLDEKHFADYPSLKVVATPSTGVNHLDTNYLKKRKVETFCLLDDRETLKNIHASAEFTWVHIMNAVRKFTLSLKHMKNWREDENELLLRSNELAGKSIGIIGMGRIGTKILKYSKAFNMKAYWYDPYVKDQYFYRLENAKKVNSLEELKNCDIISINCYLTEETKHLITHDVFKDFKENLVVVNTSRGEVVDEDYVYDLIVNDRIFYSCDVLQGEQDIEKLKKSKLYNLKRDNLVITPHVAGATVESQTKALNAAMRLCKHV